MLTVTQIHNASFGKANFSGYKTADVDNFLDEVAASFEQLEAERNDALKRAQEMTEQAAELAAKNEELQEKLAILAQKIETYREDEDGIKEALISAQRMSKKSVDDAKDKAGLILQDAKEEANAILDNAKVDATRAAQEYMEKIEEKKAELEEMKRQVTAFRSSLMEMYKKHLECIDHIPVFVTKEREEAAAKTEKPQTAEPEEEPAPAPVEEPAMQPEETFEPVQEEPAPESETSHRGAPVESAPHHHTINRKKQEQKRTLHDRVDFTKEDTYNDLSEVGIDLKTYNNIPESLRQEKDSHYSHLEFGDDVDLGRKKRKK